MDVIRLRTLTRKSVLGFGLYKDSTVGQVLDAGHTRYLRWIYYNMSMISFVDEILYEIHAFERIEKPGKDPDLGDRMSDQIFAVTNRLNPTRAIKSVQASKKQHKRRSYTFLKADRRRFSKGNMQAKNHGR